MGHLVLIDGSPFDWLGTGTPRLLLGAVDDATSTVLALHLRPAEDLHGYLTLLQQLAARHGLPVTLYGDRLGVFVRNDAHWSLEEELQGRQHPTQFGRSCGISASATSPPTRPRRRAASNGSGPPSKIGSSPSCTSTGSTPWTRPRPTCPPISPITTAASPTPPPSPWPLAPATPRSRGPAELRYTGMVARDNTVRGPRWVQIPRGPHGRSYARCRVDVRERLDRRLLVDYQGTAWSPPPRRATSSSSPVGRDADAPPERV